MHKNTLTISILLIILLSAALLLFTDPVTSGKTTSNTFFPIVANYQPLIPYLVKDINTQTPSSYIYCPVSLGNRMLCSAKDDEHGFELWISNGLPDGASLLKDINPGWKDSNALADGRYPTLKNFVLFPASGDNVDLWRSDGTENGTYLVKNGFREISSDEPFAMSGDIVYFLADDGEHGLELWRSDGSTSGTKMVKDILPGFDNKGIQQLTPLGEKLYFIVAGDGHNTLWVSNGTNAGTNPVSAVTHGSVTKIAPFENMLILDMRSPPDEHTTLWRSDGTAQGTTLISDYGSYKGLELSDFATLDSKVIFTFRYDNQTKWGIGATDGTSDGTSLYGIVEQAGSGPLHLLAAGSHAFFFERRYQEEDSTLWRTDGTQLGTIPLGKFWSTEHACTAQPLVYDAKLYFPAMAKGYGYGCELWISDGTPAGTHMIADIAPGFDSSWPRPGIWFKDYLYFTASDITDDIELWRTDGTAAGTTRADDVRDYPTDHSYPGHLTPQPHGIYLSAWTGGDVGLWRSDGTEGGTVLVKSFGHDPIANPLAGTPWAMAGGYLYFITNVPPPDAIWRSDGTTAGTIQLTGPPECSWPYLLAPQDDQLFFIAAAKGGWLCLAGEPNEKITNLGDRVVDILATDSFIYFRLESEKIGVSDGTSAGTRIYDTPSLTISPVQSVAAIEDTVYFNGCDEQGCELWKLEGPHSAPVRVADLAAGPDSGEPYGLTALNDILIFTAVGSVEGPLLWSSDGTFEGTMPFAEAKMCFSGYLPEAAVLGDQLYFRGVDSEQNADSPTGCELWITDGTFHGTQLVKDIWPGPMDSSPHSLTAAGDHVFFTAHDPSGCKAWASDGTADGTFIIPDIYCPGQYTLSDGKLYFSSNQDAIGTELWALIP